MLTADRSGIRCDRCRMELRTQFIYYSCDCRKRTAYVNRLPEDEFKTAPELAPDLCEKCYAQIAEEVVKNYQPTPSKPGRVYPQGIFCDLTRTHMSGNFDFYHCTFQKVQVSTTNNKMSSDLLDSRALEIWIHPNSINLIQPNPPTETEEWSTTSGSPNAPK